MEVPKKQSFYSRYQALAIELNCPKNQFNKFGKYKYRSLEDITESIKPLLTKYELMLNFKDTMKIVGEYTFVESKCIIKDLNSDESEYSEASAGIEKQGGMSLAQAFGSASSYARKYAANALLLLDDNKDDDNLNTHGKESKVGKPANSLLTSEQKTTIKALLNNKLITEDERTPTLGMIDGNKMTAQIAVTVIKKLKDLIASRES